MFNFVFLHSIQLCFETKWTHLVCNLNIGTKTKKRKKKENIDKYITNWWSISEQCLLPTSILGSGGVGVGARLRAKVNRGRDAHGSNQSDPLLPFCQKYQKGAILWTFHYYYWVVVMPPPSAKFFKGKLNCSLLWIGGGITTTDWVVGLPPLANAEFFKGKLKLQCYCSLFGQVVALPPLVVGLPPPGGGFATTRFLGWDPPFFLKVFLSLAVVVLPPPGGWWQCHHHRPHK